MKTAIILLISSLLSNCFSQTGLQVKRPAPQISITDWIANYPEEKSLAGKNLVLEFWATWCGPCIAAVPHMNELQQKYKDNDLQFLSLTDESPEKVHRTLKRVNFQSIVASDQTGQTQLRFSADGKSQIALPLTVLIDKKGIVQWVGHPTELNEEVLDELINANEKQITVPRENENIQKQDTLTFKKLLTSRIGFYFSMKPSKSDKPMVLSAGAQALKVQKRKLSEIYSAVFKVNENNLSVPESYQDQYFDLMYKNMLPGASLDTLEIEMLKFLKLNKSVATGYVESRVVSIVDRSKMEPAIDSSFVAKSGADNQIIFTSYRLEDLITELSLKAEMPFEMSGNETGRFDFIIDISSQEGIEESLESYGLEVSKSQQQIEKILLSER